MPVTDDLERLGIHGEANLLRGGQRVHVSSEVFEDGAERHGFVLEIGGAFVGAVFLGNFPSFAKEVLHGDEQVATLLLVVFSVGIGIGSLLCEMLSRRMVEIGLVPLGALGMTVFAIDLYLACSALPAHAGAALGLAAFVQDEWAMSPQWSSYLGLRVESIEVRSVSRVDDLSSRSEVARRGTRRGSKMRAGAADTVVRNQPSSRAPA